MHSDTLAAPTLTLPARSDTATRLAVTWQHPVNRRHEPVGLLTCDSGLFRFRYLARADDVEGFQPFLGTPDLNGDHVSPRLFPLFAQRVMRLSRPDFPRYLEALCLPSDADQWQILARSQGQREGDGIRVFMEPLVDANGATRSTFLVHGVRHRLAANPHVEAALAALVPGEQLTLVNEPDNPADAQAILVSDQRDVALGWIPSVLLTYVNTAVASGTTEIRVERANDPSTPPGYRLLVTLHGHVPPGHRPFHGPDWEPHTS